MENTSSSITRGAAGYRQVLLYQLLCTDHDIYVQNRWDDSTHSERHRHRQTTTTTHNTHSCVTLVTLSFPAAVKTTTITPWPPPPPPQDRRWRILDFLWHTNRHHFRKKKMHQCNNWALLACFLPSGLRAASLHHTGRSATRTCGTPLDIFKQRHLKILRGNVLGQQPLIQGQYFVEEPFERYLCLATTTATSKSYRERIDTRNLLHAHMTSSLTGKQVFSYFLRYIVASSPYRHTTIHH